MVPWRPRRLIDRWEGGSDPSNGKEGTDKMNHLKNMMIEWVISCLSGKAQTLAPRYGFYAWACLGLRGVPVVLLRGPTLQSGRIGTLLVAGHDPWVGYLPNRFFIGEPHAS